MGWNAVEYEALGQRFDQRGRRLTEQIGLLGQLWTEPSLSFDGEFDTITPAGLAPLPVHRPIPIWIGGKRPACLGTTSTLRGVCGVLECLDSGCARLFPL